MAQRTIVEFPVASDPWPAIDAWASSTGHSIAEQGTWGRRYQRGDGFFIPRTCVQIAVGGPGLRVESWILVWFTGGEMDVSSGDPIQYFPRRKARALLNRLLADLGQAPVK